MNICVYGLWHLGTVIAGCLANYGHQVVGLDDDEENVGNLCEGQAPIYEPGLDQLVEKGLSSGNLRFTTNVSDAISDQDILWITFDTPVDENDQADVEYVVSRVKKIFKFVKSGTLVLISSQLPVGTTRSLQKAYMSEYPDKLVHFAYLPENLRLGKAINVFTKPDRIVAGIDDDYDKKWIENIYSPFTDRIEWMSIESSEMTKHAINAFLALSITFINEISTVCEQVGADAKEVERGLKSEERIGPKAYLSPGGAFSGGTLARDVNFLSHLGEMYQQPLHLIPSVKRSNDSHRLWACRRLQQIVGNFDGKIITVLGLTYKAGTDTLRRSNAVEICMWLVEHGAIIQAHDPAIDNLPDHLSLNIRLFPTALQALAQSEALIIATEWPCFKSLTSQDIIANMKTPLIIDANRFLSKELTENPSFQYITVGRSPKRI